MRVAIYARKSKHVSQSESIKNQIDLCKSYCENNFNYTKTEEYWDDGFTGKNTTRPSFQRLLNDIKDSKIDIILVYRVDRLCRNTKDFYSILDLLDSHNIQLKPISENFDLDSTTGRAMAVMYSIFAQFERECISERIKDNMYELAKSGRWLGGPAPFGYKFNKIVKDNKTLSYLVEDEVQSETVKLLYNKFIKLGSLTKVRKYAYENSITGPQGNILDLSSLSKILRNPLYAKSTPDIISFLENKNMNVIGDADHVNGFFTYGKNNISSIQPIATISNHNGIIDGDTWLKVQNLLLVNSTKFPREKTGKKSLLSGLLKCKLCGSNMRISYKKPNTNGIQHSYYICGSKKTFGAKACSCSNLNANYVDRLVINYINKIDLKTLIELFRSDNLFKSNFDTTSAEFFLLKKNIEIKNKSLANLTNSLSMTSDSTIINTIIKKMETISLEIDNLNKHFDTITSISSDINSSVTESINHYLNNFNDFLENETLESRLNFINLIVSKIEWDSSTNDINIIFK